jgi:ubiquinone/menaquinone biosynthesis C-methylase UbiE
LDFSACALEQLAKEGIEAVKSILPDIPLPDDTYDVAIATELLEHLDHPLKTLYQMARVVKPGGNILCSVPKDRLHPYDELEHQRCFAEESLRLLLSKISSDIEIKSVTTFKNKRVESYLARAVIQN